MWKQLIFGTGIFMLMLAGQSLGFLIVKQPCPEITTTSFFNMTLFAGKWYTYMMYPIIREDAPACRYVEFIKKENHHDYYPYTAKKSEIRDGIVTVTKTDMTYLNEEGYYQLAPSIQFPRGMKLNVLNTDHFNYALCFVCIDVYHTFSLHWAVMQTRKRIPDTDTETHVKNLALWYGLNIRKLLLVPQDACPADA